jgi:hypothetical protein
MLEKEEIREKIEEGWIKAVMWFEVMTSERELAENSLKDHVKSIQNMKNAYILSEKFEDTIEVENPPRNVEKAFSKVAQVELLSKNIETLLFAVIYFGPSSVEIMEPKELTIGIDSMQAIMNSVADVVHKLAASGAGGIVISTKDMPKK